MRRPTAPRLRRGIGPASSWLGNGSRMLSWLQREARGAAERITEAIDSHVLVERASDDDDGAAGALVPVAG